LWRDALLPPPACQPPTKLARMRSGEKEKVRANTSKHPSYEINQDEGVK
jgi:hypothetical protein